MACAAMRMANGDGLSCTFSLKVRGKRFVFKRSLTSSETRGMRAEKGGADHQQVGRFGIHLGLN